MSDDTAAPVAPPPEAARVDDPVGHSLGMAGLVAGAALGALAGAALIAGSVLTGGALAAAVVGAVAGGALAGGQLAHGLQAVMHLPNPTTGTLRTGSANVRVNGRGAVRAGVDGVYACHGLYGLNHVPLPLVPVAEGSRTVRVNGKPFARVGSRLMCAATVGDGSATVRVGGPTEQVLAVVDVERIVTVVALVAGGGALLAGGGFAVAAGLFGEFLLVGGAVAGGNELLGKLGDHLGPGWRDVLQGAGGLALLGLGGVKARGAGAQQAEVTAAAARAEAEARALGGRGPIRLGPVRGVASGRDFDPGAAGGPVRSLSTDRVRVTRRGVDVVERHVGRFGADESNEGMVQRLRDIADGKLEPTDFDRRFYTHELREYVRYRRLGWPEGLPESDDAKHTLWNDAHTATLEDYGLNERTSPLYHPDWDPSR